MATIGAIAAKKDAAVKRITAASAQLAERLALEVAPFPLHGRDRDYLQASQLEAVANILEAVSTALEKRFTTSTEPVDWDALTVAELKTLAEEREIEYPANIKKADLIDLLRLDWEAEGADDGSSTTN